MRRIAGMKRKQLLTLMLGIRTRKNKKEQDRTREERRYQVTKLDINQDINLSTTTTKKTIPITSALPLPQLCLSSAFPGSPLNFS